jgi:hypothetical protein
MSRLRPCACSLTAWVQQTVEPGGQCQPPSPPLLPAPRLLQVPVRFGFAPALLHALMAQQLTSLVVQHGASSFPVSRGLALG